MFVRCKVMPDGRAYYYLVASVRDGGRVRQKTLAYLGEHMTAEAALERMPAEIAELEAEALRSTSRAEEFRRRMNPAWLEDGRVPRPSGRGGLRAYNKLCSRFWYYTDRAERKRAVARQKESQLANIRVACSAYGFPAVQTTVITTPVVHWYEHPNRYKRHGDSTLVGVLKDDDRTLCVLVRVGSRYLNGSFRLGNCRRVWREVESAMETLKLPDEARLVIRQQVIERIPLPGEEEAKAEDAAYWDGVRRFQERLRSA